MAILSDIFGASSSSQQADATPPEDQPVTADGIVGDPSGPEVGQPVEPPPLDTGSFDAGM